MFTFKCNYCFMNAVIFSSLWGYLSFWNYFSYLPYLFFHKSYLFFIWVVFLSRLMLEDFHKMFGEPYHLLIFEWICALVLLTVVVFPWGSYYALLGPLHISIYQVWLLFNWSIPRAAVLNLSPDSDTIKNYWGSYRPVLLSRNIMQIKKYKIHAILNI